MDSLKPVIAPSMLSCDFARLAEEAKRMINCGADWLHMDVMDGHFVPNITIGSPVIKSLRQHCPDAFLDCHMMVSNPEKWIDDFKKAGASQYTFHIEAVADVENIVKQIKGAGMKVGVAVKPNTTAEEVVRRLRPVIDSLHMVLVMTVEPGFGGQAFMENMMPKVKEIRKSFPSVNIQVDGGLAPDTVQKAAAAGANVIVAGTSIFKSQDPEKTIRVLRDAVSAAQPSWKDL